jgi:hypothetical protein
MSLTLKVTSLAPCTLASIANHVPMHFEPLEAPSIVDNLSILTFRVGRSLLAKATLITSQTYTNPAPIQTHLSLHQLKLPKGWEKLLHVQLSQQCVLS